MIRSYVQHYGNAPVPWGVKAELFRTLVDGLIFLMEEKGEMVLAAVLMKRLSVESVLNAGMKLELLNVERDLDHIQVGIEDLEAAAEAEGWSFDERLWDVLERLREVVGVLNFSALHRERKKP